MLPVWFLVRALFLALPLFINHQSNQIRNPVLKPHLIFSYLILFRLYFSLSILLFISLVYLNYLETSIYYYVPFDQFPLFTISCAICLRQYSFWVGVSITGTRDQIDLCRFYLTIGLQDFGVFVNGL